LNTPSYLISLIKHLRFVHEMLLELVPALLLCKI